MSAPVLTSTLDLEGAEARARAPHNRALAEELTRLVHGEQELLRVQAASAALFGHGALEHLDEATLVSALAEAPSTRVDGEVPSLVDLLAAALGLSKSEARRAVRDGGAYLNNVRVEDLELQPTQADLVAGSWLVLRRGKKNFAGVQVA